MAQRRQVEGIVQCQHAGWQGRAVRHRDLQGAVVGYVGIGKHQAVGVPYGSCARAMGSASYLDQTAADLADVVGQVGVQLLHKSIHAGLS